MWKVFEVIVTSRKQPLVKVYFEAEMSITKLKTGDLFRWQTSSDSKYCVILFHILYVCNGAAKYVTSQNRPPLKGLFWTNMYNFQTWNNFSFFFYWDHKSRKQLQFFIMNLKCVNLQRNQRKFFFSFINFNRFFRQTNRKYKILLRNFYLETLCSHFANLHTKNYTPRQLLQII